MKFLNGPISDQTEKFVRDFDRIISIYASPRTSRSSGMAAELLWLEPAFGKKANYAIIREFTLKGIY